ncbi:MAG: WG repeat-containing protein [Clostridia bacterium]|nr:WG repeat-containing protein [Clostridia bacterium]
MNNKKQIRFVCLLLLCATLTGMLQPATADANGTVKAVQVLRQMQEMTLITGTNLLLTQEPNKSKWGLYDTDGNIVIPLEHESLSYVAYNYLNVGTYPNKTYNEHLPIPLDEVNTHALMAFDGTALTEYVYGTFQAFSPLWSVGWVLEQGTKQDYDFTPDKEHYLKIERCDVFYRENDDSAAGGKPTCRLVASLSRDEFQTAAAHGEYLSIQSRNNEITVYNSSGEQVDIGATNLKSSAYGIKNWSLIDLATGEMLLDGCSGVSEVQLPEETVLIAARTDFQGLKWNALLSTKGEFLIPMWNVTISSVSRDYAILTSNVNGKKGLYSRVEKSLLLPCVYDQIYENKNALDPFNAHGYICVVKDGKTCFYEMATKALLPAVEWENEEAELSRYGAAFYSTVKTGKITKTRFFSPDGIEGSKLCSVKKSRGSGFLLLGSFSGGYNVVTWFGKTLLPTNYSNISITDDDRLIIKTKKSGYELYKVVEE